MDYISIKIEWGFKIKEQKALENSFGFSQTLTFGKVVQAAYKHWKLKGMLLPTEVNDALKVKNCHQWWLIGDLGKPKEPVTHPCWRNLHLGFMTASHSCSPWLLIVMVVGKAYHIEAWDKLEVWLFQLSISPYTNQPNRMTRGPIILGVGLSLSLQELKKKKSNFSS